jgi:hypothetical protein
MSLMSRIAVGAAGLLLTTTSSLFGAFKFVEWAFGLATMPGNVSETESKLAAFLGWLLSSTLAICREEP